MAPIGGHLRWFHGLHHLLNLFANISLKGKSAFGRSKLKIGINNLLDADNITGVNAFSSKTSVPNAGDVLTVVSGRSASVAITFDLARK